VCIEGIVVLVVQSSCCAMEVKDNKVEGYWCSGMVGTNDIDAGVELLRKW